MIARRDQRARGRSLKRSVGIRKPKKTLLVFCEGERTEPEYLNALKRQPSVRDVASVDLRVETGQGGSVPLTLVSLAVDARRRARDEDGEIDEFWCVFDVEWPRNHPGLKEAIERARQNNIKLAISNPCFELWLILHYKYQGAWLNNDDTDFAEAWTAQMIRALTPLSTCRSGARQGVTQKHLRSGTVRTEHLFRTTTHRLACIV